MSVDPRKPDVVTVAVSRVDGGVTVLRVITREYQPPTPEEREKGLVRVQTWEIKPTPEYVSGLIARYVNDGHWVGPLAPTGWDFVPNDYVDERTDRYFRGAWKHAPGRGKPDVDMPKAREIHRTRLRRMRAPLLEQLDNEYLRADEHGDQPAKRDISFKKQALRDVTADPRIEAAQTPDELKAVIPEALRG